MRTSFVAVALFIAMCIACTFAFEHPRLEAVPSETEAQSLFQNFKAEYEITYKSTEEEAQKFAVFQENLKEIVRLNKINTKATFVINKFADWTKEERNRLSGTRIPDELVKAAKAQANTTLPAISELTAVDWRAGGAVTPIKDQGQCGSCWAFSAAECIDSAWVISGNGLNVASPQNILDCSGQGSCNGGNPNNAINAMGGGIDFDWAYPYVGYQQGCGFNGNIAAYTGGSVGVAASEGDVWNTLQSTPVGIVIDALNIGFFGSGYMDSSNCDSSGLDHAVQVVGLAYANDGTPCWIVKNSWGTWWGDQGYFYIAYGQGACLIGSWNYYANA